MINTVRQLMHNIRLFCGTQCSAALSWRQARTKNFRTTDEADTAHVVSELPTARKPSFLPTSFKSPHYLRPMRARDTAYFESYATDVFITPCLSPCSIEGQSEHSVALINVAINFFNEYFSFVIYFSKILFQHFFFQNLFSKFFSQNFFSKNFCPTSFQNLIFEVFTLKALPFTDTKRTLCICVMKNIIYRKI